MLDQRLTAARDFLVLNDVYIYLEKGATVEKSTNTLLFFGMCVCNTNIIKF